MDYSELLHDFLDGELDPVHEDALFGALQRNEHLRLEMKDLLEMRRAVEADKAAFLPSATSTNAIFSQLGFAAPAAAGGAAALTGESTAVAAASGFGLAQMAGVFAGAALLTSLVFVGLIMPALDDQTGSRLLEADAPARILEAEPIEFTMVSPPESIALNNGVAAAHTVDTQRSDGLPAAASNRGFGASSPAEHSSYVDKQENQARAEVAVEESVSASQLLAGQPTLSMLTDAAQSTQFHTIETVPVAMNLSDEFTPEGLPSVTFELRGNGDAKFFQETDVESVGDPWFNEMSASMLLPVNDHFEFGVTFGQEVFSQVFYRDEANGDRIEYQQRPRLFWGGVTGRAYPFTENTAMLAPYTQLTFGFNFFGTVIKPSTGLRFTPDNSRMSMYLGAEYSHLLYWEDQNMFSSGKLNLNYGVSYRL